MDGLKLIALLVEDNITDTVSYNSQVFEASCSTLSSFHILLQIMKFN